MEPQNVSFAIGVMGVLSPWRCTTWTLTRRTFFDGVSGDDLGNLGKLPDAVGVGDETAQTK